MIQPGAVGDIHLCLPIAKWYADQGYEIVWPVREKFMKHLRNIDYVTPHLLTGEDVDHDWLRSDVIKCIGGVLNEQKFDYVLNLADRGPGPMYQRMDENFEQAKYRQAQVPFEEKHRLDWVRFRDNEDYIYEEFVGDSNAPYAFVHATSSHGEDVDLSFIQHRIVTCEDIGPDYNIFDWYRVIVDASEIYVTESSIWAFCDGIVNKTTPFRYLLPRDQMGSMTTISNNWRRDYLNV